MNLYKCVKCKKRDNHPKIRDVDMKIYHFKCFEKVKNVRIWYNYTKLRYEFDYGVEIIN